MQTESMGQTAANNFTVARVRQDLANRSSIGGLFVNRQATGSLAGIGAGRTSVSQSWKVTGHFFACTFASGAQAVGTISEFFRKMARPAGFEPATLGLEGPLSDRLSGAGYHPRRFDRLDLAHSRRFLPHFAVSSPRTR